MQPYPVGTPWWKDKDDPVTIRLLIEHDGDEVLVSESRFHIHATGSTKEEALENFWRVFFGYEEVLTKDENALSEYMQAQLKYVREVKAWELGLRAALEAQKSRYALDVPLNVNSEVEDVSISMS